MNKLIIFCISFLLLLPFAGKTQVTAPGADATDKTNYPFFSETDSIYIFCTENEVSEVGVLQVQTALEGTKTFNWEKYNNETAQFEFYYSESTDAATSRISGLADGAYRVSILQGETTEVYRAWVFNNWISVSGSVANSDCESFKLVGTFLSAGMKYYDLEDNSEVEVYTDIRVEWKKGEEIIASVLSPEIFDPPTEDTDYTLRVYDRFGCEYSTEVTYVSIVTKASFTADPMQGEAPLEVVFNNTSENGDLDQYEWFFYRNLDDIKQESENSEEPVDSIMVVAYDENPVYIYENTGSYMVKLVSKKVSEYHTCVDTFYLEEYIIVDSSFVEVPNVFTPNGDGNNDNFVVKFWSMQSIETRIYNRRGRKIHY